MNALIRMTSLILLVALQFFLTSFAAQATTVEQDAISHLVRFVETSSCIFVRNGSEYDSREAVNHIKKKYAYFKSEIHTAEDFIAFAASKSEFSGKPYFVRCGKGTAIPTADWLSAELRNFRSLENKN